MKKIAIMGLATALAVASQAVLIESFVNADFDSGGTSGPFKGFDAPAAPEIIGWTNLNDAPSLNDAGVEGPGAWWGPYDNQAAFMRAGDGAYNMSTYTILAGDTFTVDFFAKRWNVGETAAWTVTLFYDTPANVIGTYTTPGNLPFITQSTGWAEYTSTPIAATPASVGGTLGVLFVSSGPNFANLDEVTVDVIPEPATIGLVGAFGIGTLFVRRRLMM